MGQPPHLRSPPTLLRSSARKCFQPDGVEKGRKHTAGYNTEYGMIEVGVTARRINVDMDDSGGHFDLEYVVEVNNQITSFTTLNVRVQ